MRIKAIAASLIVICLSAALVSNTASAQSINKRKGKGQGQGQGKGEGAGRRNATEEDLDAPVNMRKFPGVGSIDAWKTSVPEFREGVNKAKNARWDEAIAHFRASIALYEYQPDAWWHIGRCIERKGGLLSDAEVAYRHCLDLDKQSLRGWKGLGNVLYMEKKYDEARQSLSNAVNLNPTAKQKQALDKMIQMVDAAQSHSNTQPIDTGSN